jgi:hypothetical protein
MEVKTRKKKGFTDDELKKYSIVLNNPFLTDFTLKAKSFEKEGNELMIGDGDDAHILSDSVLFESDKFTKFYSSPERRLHLATLSPRGHHLLSWVSQKICDGNDLIWINRHAYMDESGIKRQETYISAVSDLVEHKVLNRASFSVDVYWINPYFFFKGNRLKKYGSYLKKENIKSFKKSKK